MQAEGCKHIMDKNLMITELCYWDMLRTLYMSGAWTPPVHAMTEACTTVHSLPVQSAA